jgi:hypothetical protein
VILDRIDNTLDGLCPCGAEPREGSAYCSYDCEPNIRGEHTDLSPAGAHATPMRWRPDLVTAADDGSLTFISASRQGQFTASMYHRAGYDGFHLRLDDGHRFVGTDFCPEVEDAEADPRLFARVWERLERELTDPRHAVASEPDPDSFIESVLPRVLDDEYARRRWMAMYYPPVLPPTVRDLTRITGV